MGVENLLYISADVGRKVISYIGTDPAGELSLLTGYNLMDKSVAASIPFFLLGVWHVPKMIGVRKRLNNAVKENNGLNEKILEPFNKNSWCSHRVAMAYAYGEGKYKEFRDLFNKHDINYYVIKLRDNIKGEISHLFNPKSSKR